MQEVLLNAAVIGREFEFELLWRITNKPEDDMIDCLEVALKAQLIEEVDGGDRERDNDDEHDDAPNTTVAELLDRANQISGHGALPGRGLLR